MCRGLMTASIPHLYSYYLKTYYCCDWLLNYFTTWSNYLPLTSEASDHKMAPVTALVGNLIGHAGTSLLLGNRNKTRVKVNKKCARPKHTTTTIARLRTFPPHLSYKLKNLHQERACKMPRSENSSETGIPDWYSISQEYVLAYLK